MSVCFPRFYLKPDGNILRSGPLPDPSPLTHIPTAPYHQSHFTHSLLKKSASAHCTLLAARSFS